MGKKSKSKMPKFMASASSSTTATSSLLVQHAQTGAFSVASHASHAATALNTATTPHVIAPSQPRLGKAARRKVNESTAGAAWGHMKAPEMTPELKRELLIVKMRGVLDPKRFYRGSDSGKGLPKYFQMGTIVSGAEDGRDKLTKKERKGSMLQELMSDATVRKRAKSQFLKSQEAAMAGRTKPKNKRGAIGKKSGASARRANVRR